MVIELVVMLAHLAVGVLLLKAIGLSGWATLPLGFLVGTGLAAPAILVQAFLRTPSSLVFPLGVLVLASAGFWLRQRGRGIAAGFDPVAVVGGVALVVLVVVVAWAANLVTYHYDSVEYATAASLIGQGEFASMSSPLLLKRLGSASLLNSSATLFGGFYLRSLMPMTSLATLGCLAWVVHTGVSHLSREHLARWAGGLAVGLLATTYGFLWQSFYVNGHLLFGASFLLAVGAAWLLAISAPVESRVLVVLVPVGLVGALLARSESVFFVVLALVPILLSAAIEVGVRRRIGQIVAVTLLFEQAVLWSMVSRTAGGPMASITGRIVIGLLLLVGVALLDTSWIKRGRRGLRWTVEVVLWLAVAVFAAIDATVLVDSVAAMVSNLVLGKGMWGISIVTLVLLAAWALWRGVPQQPLLRIPVTASLPMMLVMAYLRGGSLLQGEYRVGTFDTMNRMVLHVVPVLVLLVIVGLAVDRADTDGATRDGATPAR